MDRRKAPKPALFFCFSLCKSYILLLLTCIIPNLLLFCFAGFLLNQFIHPVSYLFAEFFCLVMMKIMARLYHLPRSPAGLSCLFSYQTRLIVNKLPSSFSDIKKQQREIGRNCFLFGLFRVFLKHLYFS